VSKRMVSNSGACDHGGAQGSPEQKTAYGYHTPTGAPCPRTIRLDGSVEGSGDCVGCGYCQLLVDAAWGGDDTTTPTTPTTTSPVTPAP
jgi:hypothetical protein